MLSYDSESSGQNSLALQPLIDRLTSPDIIESWVEASLRDRLHGCGQQGLGGSV
jgi:hypothetical protein